jgi:hypothetical protein
VGIRQTGEGGSHGSAAVVQQPASAVFYLSRCPEDLQARNLNYWIEQERQRRDTFFCRFDANRLRAVFTERYTAIDHMEVLTKILENGFDPAGEIQFALDDEMMVLKMPEYEQSVSPGRTGQNRSRHFHRQQ